MAGNYTEPGGPPESEGRNPGGPVDRDRPLTEHREDPRVPFEARGDDVRRDREGHGPAATGGQHRDAGTPSAEMGGQEGHQEGRQRAARPLVSAEPAMGRHPRAHRPGRTGEDRPDRGEPQEAQDVRVGSSVRTPIWDATTTAWAIFRNRPWPTTPGMPEIRAASFTGPRIGPKCASRLWFPLSVRNGSPACLRNSTFAPRRPTPARKCRAVDPVPRPRTIPGFTYARAASAAFRFSSSREAISGSPAQFLDELHELPNY